MMNFTPDDWMKIGGSWIAAYWFGRFVFLFVVGMFGVDLNEHTVNINVTGMVATEDE